ncbi:MAG TPA: hypothetical protein ENJ53_07170 [Phaeodactylibacter sp.]|nr:hypothetical protein [Phaeodactylibacter sp.]
MKNKILKYGSLLALVFALNFVVVSDTQAQCPMCKLSAEQNMKAGGTAGKGLNAGIFYMLSTPYLLVAGLGFYWYRNRRKEEEFIES